ncbi:MAG: flagellar motor protein [Actinomycetota bacterium]
MGALLGVIIGAGAVMVSMILEGGSPASLINIPAILLVFVGTFGVLAASFSLPEAIGTLKLLQICMKDRKDNRVELIRTIVGFSEKARREGLLVLEEDAKQLEDPFLRKGIQLVVDGTDPELVKDILETDLEAMETRHHVGENIFRQAGGFAPTLGIIGTVLGLVHVLHNLDQPETLGPAIAGAFLATFFGVFTANIYWLPLANALKKRTEQEAEERMLVIEGVLSIQSGDNPRIVAEKLKSFLPPVQRVAFDDEEEGAPAAAPAGAAAAEAA